jgi:hypothetical protein
MLAYLANTLIFFLVGVVIAGEFSGIRLVDLGLIGAAFVAVMTIRMALLFSARPVLAPLCHGLSPKETAVVAWGGLRGAVSLALGLVVAAQHDVPAELRRQILLMTAGVVLLTILVNGTTMAKVLQTLGFDKKPAADRLARHVTRASVLSRVREQVEQSSRSPDLRTVAWDELRRELERDSGDVDDQIRATRDELSALDPRERARGVWRQVLRVERTAYWAAFASGTIAARAARILNREIDVQLDRISAGEDKPPERRVRELPGWINRVRRWFWRAARPFGRVEFDLMALRYDLWRAEGTAAERVLAAVERLDGIDPDVREEVRETYAHYRLRSKQQLEDMRAHLPELTREIETRLAHRIRLNFERDGYDALEHQGVLDPESAVGNRAAVEHRMKQLAHQRPDVNLPETAELCRNAPLFAELDDAGIELLADLTVEKAVSAGDVLFEEGSAGDSMLVIARGAVSISRAADGEEQLLAVVGGGDVVGEMALLTGEPRNATARALTTVTLGVVSRSDFNDLLEREPSLRGGIWSSYARRAIDNLLHDDPGYRATGEALRQAWLEAGELRTLAKGAEVPKSPQIFLASGALEGAEGGIEAPAVVDPRSTVALRAAADDTRLLLLSAAPWQRAAA